MVTCRGSVWWRTSSLGGSCTAVPLCTSEHAGARVSTVVARARFLGDASVVGFWFLYYIGNGCEHVVHASEHSAESSSAVAGATRFLEAAFWSLERDGTRVSDFIEQSIDWREKIKADRLRKEDVLDQGSKGAIIVKGHDLSR